MSNHPPFRKVFDGVATREQMFQLFNRHRDTPASILCRARPMRANGLR